MCVKLFELSDYNAQVHILNFALSWLDSFFANFYFDLQFYINHITTILMSFDNRFYVFVKTKTYLDIFRRYVVKK